MARYAILDSNVQEIHFETRISAYQGRIHPKLTSGIVQLLKIIVLVGECINPKRLITECT